MEYTIQPYTKKKAKELGVEVVPSQHPKKKIDVYQEGQFLFSLGAKGMKDYPTYKRWDGAKIADERRRLYHARTAHVEPYSKAWFSRELLW